MALSVFMHRKCFERALEIYKKLHGCEHNSVAIVLMNLGGACEDAGDNAKAISLCEEALDIQEKIYGPNHFKVSSDQNPNVTVTSTRQTDTSASQSKLYLTCRAFIQH